MANGREDSIEIDLEPLCSPDERAVLVLDRFAGYEILGRLAVAGMVDLLIARDRSVSGQGRLLTLKVMRPRFARDPGLARTFARDARVALRLAHPTLCKAYRSGVEGGLPFVALELVHGLSVRDLIARAGARGDVLAPAIAVAITAIVADAVHSGNLARARAGDVVAGPRQDLGADDVMVALDGTVKLLATPHASDADVFALGLLLHEMLTGRRPSVRTLDARPRVWPRAVPPALGRLLDRALSDDPEDRYPSAAAMRLDLERYLEDERAAILPSHIAEAVRAVSEGRPQRAPLGREAFVPLRGGDATGVQALQRRGVRGGSRVLFALCVTFLAAVAIALASTSIAL